MRCAIMVNDGVKVVKVRVRLLTILTVHQMSSRQGQAQNGGGEACSAFRLQNRSIGLSHQTFREFDSLSYLA
jgi:hypothetical protein